MEGKLAACTGETEKSESGICQTQMRTDPTRFRMVFRLFCESMAFYRKPEEASC